jgi:hypothetical protein
VSSAMSLFHIDLLLANAFHKALMQSVLSYACPVWLEVVLSSLQKLLILQKRVQQKMRNAPRAPPIRSTINRLIHKLFLYMGMILLLINNTGVCPQDARISRFYGQLISVKIYSSENSAPTSPYSPG